jgi:hypothetical protein
MYRLIGRGLALLCVMILAMSGTAGAVSAPEAAQGILARNGESLVTVKLVTRHKAIYQGQERGAKEFKGEACGTVLDDSGLTVISLLVGNPMELLTSMNPEITGGEAKFESEFTDVKIILGNGAEVLGKVVLRDAELDLLFVKPEKPGTVFHPLKTNTAAEAHLLDEVIVTGRLGGSLNRELFMSVARIIAAVKKPRLYYLTSYAGKGIADNAGMPVFDLAGNALGLLLFKRPAPGEQLELGGLLGGSSILPILLPLSDILETARQVPPEQKAP